MDFFRCNNIEISDVVAIGCDGTAVNTGHKRGVIRLLEENLKDHCTGLYVFSTQTNCLCDT